MKQTEVRMKAILGLDIGGTKILGVLYDENGDVIGREKKKTKANEGLEIVISQVFKVIDNLLESNEVEIDRIGVGVPGIINESGVVTFSPNIPFRDFNLSGLLSDKYQVPTYIGNDVNVAMFGEYKHLKDEKIKNVLGVFVGTGIGGASIIDGKLYVGQGSAGEFGHMVVNADGAYCGCGAQGCLEAYASKTALQKYIMKQIGKGRKTILEDALNESGAVLKSSDLRKAYDQLDAVGIEAVDRCARYLGIAIGTLVNLYHPQVIILGGGIIEALGEVLLGKIIDESKQHAMPGLMGDVSFRISEMGDDAGVFGAYELSKVML